jgi:hypothetical protein
VQSDFIFVYLPNREQVFEQISRRHQVAAHQRERGAFLIEFALRRVNAFVVVSFSGAFVKFGGVREVAFFTIKVGVAFVNLAA